MRIPTRWRVCIAVCVPFVLLFVGMFGYKWIEGGDWTWFDALYMSAITLTTVGYGETRPLSPAGRTFTIVFLFGGVFTLFYTAAEIIRAVVSGQIRAALGRVRMERALAHLNGHVIVCGFGRMGKLICLEFERQSVPFAVIERDADLLAQHTFHYGIPLHGDATSDTVLEHAGIQRAKALVTVLPSDADNVFIALSAHALNARLVVIARAEDEAAETKLRRVGATHVISPYVIGGRRIAQAILRPHVDDLLENVVRNEAVDYIIEELFVDDGSVLCGQTLAESRLHDELGVMVLSIKRADAPERSLNPKGTTVLQAGDVLVVVGHRGSVEETRQRARRAAGGG